METKPYLYRNRDIVNNCNTLIGCPKSGRGHGIQLSMQEKTTRPILLCKIVTISVYVNFI